MNGSIPGKGDGMSVHLLAWHEVYAYFAREARVVLWRKIFDRGKVRS
jgi:hypothetical protein